MNNLKAFGVAVSLTLLMLAFQAPFDPMLSVAF